MANSVDLDEIPHYEPSHLDLHCLQRLGWLCEAKVSCILRHRGVQLILAYSWARPAILAAGKGRGGMFLFLRFLHFRSFSSFSLVHLFHFLYYLFPLLPFSGRRHKMTHKGWRVVKHQHSQFAKISVLVCRDKKVNHRKAFKNLFI